MATILTAEDVVRRIAAECAYVDERGGVGIRLKPAARDSAAVWRVISTAAAAQTAPSAQTGNAAVIGVLLFLQPNSSSGMSESWLGVETCAAPLAVGANEVWSSLIARSDLRKSWANRSQ
jgi:hypothetical protein